MADSFMSHGFTRKRSPDDPAYWLGSAALLDLEDPKLRLRAHALTQLCKTERDRALALYRFVKRMPFTKQLKLRMRTAREVLDAGRGDADDKAALIIALLRAADIPARLRYIELRGEILRGLTTNVTSAARPVAEIWLDDRWLRADTYIFDAAYMAAARQRLKDHDWEWGYGIHRNGHMIWSGAHDSFLGGFATENDPMVLADLGTFNDPLELVRSRAWRNMHPRLSRAVQWNMLAPMMGRVARKLRAEAGSGPVPSAIRRIS
ncbi:MAG: transglutaminase-like domain-containing protein [Ramlibacter sp.]